MYWLTHKKKVDQALVDDVAKVSRRIVRLNPRGWSRGEFRVEFRRKLRPPIFLVKINGKTDVLLKHRAHNILQRVFWWAQVSRIPLGISGDDGQRMQAVMDILITYYLVT